MEKKYIINSGLLNDSRESILDIKVVEGSETTYRDIMPKIRSCLGLGGFNVLDDSEEDSLQKKIKTKDTKIEELEKQIEELKSKSE